MNIITQYCCCGCFENILKSKQCFENVPEYKHRKIIELSSGLVAEVRWHADAYLLGARLSHPVTK